MGAVVVVGAQWGDEGKGKFIDLLAGSAKQVVRYNGGANAGHTLVVNGEKSVFHLVPSGALRKGVDCVLAQGMVIDPKVLVEELTELRRRGLYDPRLMTISERAHLVLPQHLLLDELRERGKGAIGTTKRGIGPAYEDKVARRGVRMGDLLSPSKFRNKVMDNLDKLTPIIEILGGKAPELAEVCDTYLAYAEQFKETIGDAAKRVYDALARGDQVLMEGAQGAMLDIDNGTYPFVTSSSTVAASACSGAGIGPTQISAVVGVCKAYTTRVGNGPFPTELHDALGERLRTIGGEFGATTGRPRRCGWLDIPALRHSVRINGMSSIALTKIDVLTGLDTVNLCTGYELDGKKLDLPPYDEFERAIPIYQSYPGWSESLESCKRLEDLPANTRALITTIEEMAQCQISVVGVGPGREQTIVISDPLRSGD
jgi:adenylosuccinate synthase